MAAELFVGVTTWNSELFLPHCLRALRETTRDFDLRLVVVDNVSTDRSVAISQDFGAEVRVWRSSQAIALNWLLSQSDSPRTLLMHSDVILLSPEWYPVCARRLVGDVALVSPEDTGCGPLTRPCGIDMPESCFLLFDTAKARRARTWTWTRRRGIPWPQLRLDLDHYYVTHNLPRVLARRGYSWCRMRPHASPRLASPLYRPAFTPQFWSDELSQLRYGMGNFYSLDGVITHYHNWYDRVPKDVPIDSTETTDGEGRGLPNAYLSLATRQFLADLEAGTLVLPSPQEPVREPRETPRQTPDLHRPWRAPLADEDRPHPPGLPP